MISEAVTDIKTLFSNLDLIDLDVGKEINTHGNYLVFDKYRPDETMMDTGTFTFTIYMALKSLRRGHKNAYADLDDVMTMLGTAGEKTIVCECIGIELNQFSKQLFIYAVTLEISRSW